jgi:hypothetical protein
VCYEHEPRQTSASPRVRDELREAIERELTAAASEPGRPADADGAQMFGDGGVGSPEAVLESSAT